jgi:rod shape determining protein RodA
MRRKSNILKSLDWVTVVLYAVLVGFGWLNIYAANTNPDVQEFFDPGKEYLKQLVWIGFSLVTIGIILLVDSKFFVEFSYIFYAITTILLILVIFVGVEINSAKAWFQIGSTRFQPVELAKVASTLTIAHLMSRFQFSFKRVSDLFKLIAIWLLPIIIIVLQNDTGSGLVYFAFLIVFYREGMPPHVILFGFIAVIVFILTLIIPNYSILLILTGGLGLIILTKKLYKESVVSLVIALSISALATIIFKNEAGEVNIDVSIIIGMIAVSIFLLVKALVKRYSFLWLYLLIFWGSIGFAYSTDYLFEEVLSDYQRSRILVLMGLKDDPLGAGYNVNQSKIAIGSGGLTGKGFLQGTQTKFNFVPEQSTDFIFCTVGEEWGFMGTSVVVILFVFLLIRLIFLAERQHSSFSRIYGYGVASIFFFHLAINVGMTIGLAPVIGIPLPFFSYGGSSLWGFTILLFIFLKLDTNRNELIR